MFRKEASLGFRRRFFRGGDDRVSEGGVSRFQKAFWGGGGASMRGDFMEFAHFHEEALSKQAVRPLVV